jgi:O-antigen ligase
MTDYSPKISILDNKISQAILAFIICFTAIAFLFITNPVYILIGFTIIVVFLLSFWERYRLYILLLLLPFSHAGLGINSFGGFGVFDIFLGWSVFLFLFKKIFIENFRLDLPWILRIVFILPVFYLPSLINSADYGVSVKAFVQLVASIFTAVIIYDLIKENYSRENYPGLLHFIIIETVLVSLYGIYAASQESALSNVVSGRVFFSYFGDVNYYAGYLLMIVSITMGMFLYAEKKSSRLIFILYLIVLAGGIIATVSRAGILILGLIIIFYSIISLFEKGIRKFLGIGVLTAVLGSVVLLLTTDMGKNFIDLFTLSRRVETVMVGRDASLAQREAIFDVSMRMVRVHPLIGIGYGTFESAFDSYKSTELSTGTARAAHNTFLRLLAESGLLGFIPTIVFFIYIFSYLFKSNKKFLLQRNKTLLFSIIISLFSFIVMSLTLDQFYEPHFWVFLGMGIAYVNIGSDGKIIRAE